MTSDRLLDRIRATNPAPTTMQSDDNLFARIVATRGDPRLAGPTPRRRHRWLTIGARPLVFIAATVLLGAGGTVGAISLDAFSHASPEALFRTNPGASFVTATHTSINPGSVRLAATLPVPGVGKFQFWIAQSTRHWRCEAIRLPDGTWDGFPNKFRVGGAVPGCYPPRLDSPIWVARLRAAWPGGFYYNDVQIPLPDGRTRRIEYGVTLTGGRAVEVRDIFSGASAPVIDGLYFAILLPPLDPNKTVPWRFQALDASGTVLATGIHDIGR